MYNFFTTLLLAGAALAAPSSSPSSSLEARARERCTQRSSQTKDWTVESFDYHASYTFTTPAHQNSWGYVNSTLVNRNLRYKTTCSASSSQLSDFFYGNVQYTCTEPVRGDKATFTFSNPERQLKVNQTWACPGEGSRFWAQGSAKLNLTCTESKWQNPQWSIGQIYSTRYVSCNQAEFKVPIESMQAIA